MTRIRINIRGRISRIRDIIVKVIIRIRCRIRCRSIYSIMAHIRNIRAILVAQLCIVRLS